MGEPTAGTLSVTVKSHAGQDAPWLVFYGTPTQIISQLVEAYGLPAPEGDVPLFVVVMQAHQYARQLYLLDEHLGATVDTKPSFYKDSGKPAGGRKPKEENKPTEEQESPEGALLRRVMTAESQVKLKEIWGSQGGPTGPAEFKGWGTEGLLEAAKKRQAELRAS